MTTEFYIKEVTWSTHETELRLIRQQVFIVEQHVPEPLEWDGEDADAIHLLALDANQQPVGCTRILKCGTIGRMAVLALWRGLGVGRQLLDDATLLCRARGFMPIKLSAQTHAIGFYTQAGFVVSSDPYLDANILHVDMQLTISDR